MKQHGAIWGGLVSLVAFEKLDLAFVLFRSLPCLESPKIAAFAGFGVFLSRIQAVLA